MQGRNALKAVQRPAATSRRRRLEALGGQYAPSRTADRFTEREQARVDHARDVAEAKSQPCNPF